MRSPRATAREPHSLLQTQREHQPFDALVASQPLCLSVVQQPCVLPLPLLHCSGTTAAEAATGKTQQQLRAGRQEARQEAEARQAWQEVVQGAPATQAKRTERQNACVSAAAGQPRSSLELDAEAQLEPREPFCRLLTRSRGTSGSRLPLGSARREGPRRVLATRH